MFENYWNETHKKYVNNKIVVYDHWLDDLCSKRSKSDVGF